MIQWNQNLVLLLDKQEFFLHHTSLPQFLAEHEKVQKCQLFEILLLFLKPLSSEAFVYIDTAYFVI